MKLTRLYFSIFVISLSLLLSACSPHPATGVWKATGDNELGIDRLVAGFEGRAEFITSKLDNTLWHCFWAAADKKRLTLSCTPSTNPDQKRVFVMSVNKQGLAELRDNYRPAKGFLPAVGISWDERLPVLATFIRLDENPSPAKK
jgi:hypothetical protein